MALTLFFNALTGGGAIADVTADDVLTTKVFPDGSLEPWTHFVQMPTDLINREQKIFVYNQYNRGGAIGILEKTRLNFKKIFSAGSFSPWTHITGVGSLLFFYDQKSGVGAFAETAPKILHLINVNHPVTVLDLGDIKLDPQLSPLTPMSKVSQIGPETEMDCLTVRSFPAGSFSAWTHIVSSGLNLFFYNQDTGAGSLQRVNRKTPTTVKELVVGGEVEMNMVRDFPKGSLGTWTHLTSAAPYLFFYNQNSRAGKFVRISGEGLTPIKEFGPNSFSPWTHIVTGETLISSESAGVPSVIDVPNGFGQKNKQAVFIRDDGASLLFYAKDSGIAALSTIHANNYTSGKVFGSPGAFGDWTSISDTAAVVSPYDYGYRIYRKADGSGVGFRSSKSALETEASVPPSKGLTGEQKQKVVEGIWDSWQEFYEKHEDEIKSGRIKAVDLGGILYATTAAAIVTAISPLAGAPFLLKIMGFSLTSAAEKVGRFYGAAVDDLVKTLKEIGDVNPGDLGKIIAIMKTMTLVSTQLNVVTMLGENGWELTKQVGSMIGGAVEDGIKTIAGTVGDVVGTGVDLAEGAVKIVQGVLDEIGL
jgi:hypothetical protein